MMNRISRMDMMDEMDILDIFTGCHFFDQARNRR